MEAIVRVVTRTGNRKRSYDNAPLMTRRWKSMSGRNCWGRMVVDMSDSSSAATVSETKAANDKKKKIEKHETEFSTEVLVLFFVYFFCFRCFEVRLCFLLP